MVQILIAVEVCIDAPDEHVPVEPFLAKWLQLFIECLLQLLDLYPRRI